MVGEHNQRSLVLQTITWQITGLFLLICHVLLVKLSLALYPVVIGLMGWLFARASLAGFVLCLQSAALPECNYLDLVECNCSTRCERALSL